MSIEYVRQLYSYIFKKNGSDKSLKLLEWEHFNNSNASPMTTLVLNADGDLAGVYATLAVKVKVGDVVVDACQSLDTLTDESHRGKGLFLASAKHRYKENVRGGVNFVYGFPNGSSMHGFVKHLDWHLLDSIPFLIKPVRLNYFFKKILKINLPNILNLKLSRVKKIKRSPYNIQSIERFDSRFDKLWLDFTKNIKVAVVRDCKYLNWRFIDKPDGDYFCYGLFKEEQLLGYVVFCTRKKHGGNVGYVMELIGDLADENVLTKLLEFASSEMIKADVDFILAWNFKFSPSSKAFKKCSYFSLHNRLRPIELHFGYAGLSENNALLSSRENWYLSYADSDTV